MQVLILGGAGFLGSHLAEGFLGRGAQVTVIDGLISGTGGRPEHLETAVAAGLQLVELRVEECADLLDHVGAADLIVDAMALTAHHRALAEPLLDLDLNAASHLHLLSALADCPGKRVLYLGSRGQYGNPKIKQIREDSPQEPTDIQGIHKTAAESYYRVYASMGRCSVVSLRIPNCFGPHQPVSGVDIGLIGSLIRDPVQDQSVEVYGAGRSRAFLYVNDLVDAVLRLVDGDWGEFDAYNIAGQQVAIEDLVQHIIQTCGRGSYQVKELPPEIRAIDTGTAQICQEKLIGKIGSLQQTALSISLPATIQYFEEQLHDVAM